MPAVIGRGPKPRAPIEVPRRVALALQPELERVTIPSRVTLDANAPPFAGELREEHTGPLLNIAPGAVIVLAALRRPWTFVGFAVDPGDVAGAGLTAALRVLTRGVNGVLMPFTPILVGTPQAFPAIILGAMAELLLANGTAGVVHNVRGSIWGMSEK